MTARTIATVLVCLAVVFAGCGGALDSAKERAKDAAEDAAEDAASDALNESGVGNFADMPANVTMLGFGFDQPATYTYEIMARDGTLSSSDGQQVSGRLVVTVEEVSGGTVTLTTRYELGGETIERTFSGSQQEVAAKFGTFALNSSTNASPGMRALRAQTNGAFTFGHTLYLIEHGLPFSEALSRAGEDNEAVTYDSAGTDSYAGVKCSVTTASVKGKPVAESCVSTELGLPVSVVIYGDDGTPSVRVELVEYES